MALLLGAGGFYVWRYDSDLRLGSGASDPAKSQALLFPDLKLSELNRIGVIRGDGSWNVLRVTGEQPKDPFGNPVQWELKRPKGAPVEPTKVETMVRALAGLRIRNTLEKNEIGDDESIYGLTPPPIVLQLEGTFGKRVVSLGEKHPISGRRYVQVEGDEKLYLTEDSIFSLLDVAPDSLRSAQVLAFDPKRVKKVIAIREEGNIVSLEASDAKGNWKIVGPGVEVEADATQVQNALSRLSKAKVKRFIDDTPETLAFFGLARPKLIVSLVFDSPTEASPGATPSATPTAAPEGDPAAAASAPAVSGEAPYFPRNKPTDRVVIQIGEGINTDALLPPTPGESTVRSKASYFGKLSGVKTIFEFGRSYFSDFLQTADHFRTKFPFRSISPESLGEIHLTFGGKDRAEFKLSRSGTDGWAVAQGEAAPRPVSVEDMAKLVDAIRRLRVVSYTTLPDQVDSMGLQDPELAIRLVQRSAEKSYTIRIGNALPSSGEPAPALEVGDPSAPPPEAPPRFGAIAGLVPTKAPIETEVPDTALGAVLSSSTAATITAQARRIGGLP